MNSQLLALAREIAETHKLDPALVCAVIEQESSWDPFAIRYEPAFRTRYVVRLSLPATEEIARSISWGLMQVMGQVAREHGYAGRSVAGLCDPGTGIDVGCAVLMSKLSAANGDVKHALELWNGGANPNYAPQVLERCGRYR